MTYRVTLAVDTLEETATLIEGHPSAIVEALCDICGRPPHEDSRFRRTVEPFRKGRAHPGCREDLLDDYAEDWAMDDPALD